MAAVDRARISRMIISSRVIRTTRGSRRMLAERRARVGMTRMPPSSNPVIRNPIPLMQDRADMVVNRRWTRPISTGTLPHRRRPMRRSSSRISRRNRLDVPGRRGMDITGKGPMEEPRPGTRKATRDTTKGKSTPTAHRKRASSHRVHSVSARHRMA